MEKKNYLTPSLEVHTLLTDQMIATSNIPYGGTTDETEPNEAKRMRNQRGQWGDLWDEYDY